ncbi:protein INVOLVED IN DE NOVO [Trifolium repens]|nr:protein INVOLVED IN DE NOVO [Trifolium repens]
MDANLGLLDTPPTMKLTSSVALSSASSSLYFFFIASWNGPVSCSPILAGFFPLLRLFDWLLARNCIPSFNVALRFSL